MVADAAAYGALFLLALFAPAYTSDPSILAGGSDTPLLILLGVGGAAGVGSMLTLTGNAIWEFLYPYAPGSGLDRFLATGSRFRLPLAKANPAWRLTGSMSAREGDRALVVTEFDFYRQAPENVREWVRRRNERFVSALTAGAALVLGIGIGAALLPINERGLALDVAFGVLAVGSLLFGHQAHRHAEQIERYWFARVGAALESDEVAAED